MVRRHGRALGQSLGRGERLRGRVDAGVQRFHVEPGGNRGGVHFERAVVDGCAVLPVPLDAGHLTDALPVLVVFLVWHLSVQSPDTDRSGDGDRDGDPVCAPATWAEFLHRQLDRVSGDSCADDHRFDQPVCQQCPDADHVSSAWAEFPAGVRFSLDGHGGEGGRGYDAGLARRVARRCEGSVERVGLCGGRGVLPVHAAGLDDESAAQLGLPANVGRFSARLQPWAIRADQSDDFVRKVHRPDFHVLGGGI